MSFDTYWRFLLALVFVVLLIGACAWLARRFGIAGRFMAPGGKRRLSIVEVLPLDARHRLVLVRRDDTEHLVLLGQHGNLVIEHVATAGAFAAMVEPGAP